MTQAHKSLALDWFDKHRERLDAASDALASRACWSAFPEVPSEKIHGEGSAARGKAAFEGHHNQTYELPGFKGSWTVGEERSPYGLELNISYPTNTAAALVELAGKGGEQLARLSPNARIGIALEVLDRLWARSFEIGHAVMHTTGQGFMMAFQAGATHAFDRALEAVAYASDELGKVPGTVRWEKPRGKRGPLVLEKRYRMMPRGIGLVVACATFPNWNGYPAIFANLVCGNPLIVKPHPKAVLPLAITVEVMRAALEECGLNPDAVVLAVDSSDAPLAKDLACDPEVRVIDYTGGSEFGIWLERNAHQARLFAEKSGVNCAMVGPGESLDAAAGNLALSLALYSGQMCTAPQNVYVPKEHFDSFAGALEKSLDGLLGDERRAAEVLGAIQSEDTIKRVEAAEALEDIVRASDQPKHPMFADARMRSPLVARLTPAQDDWHQREHFGPIAFLIEVSSAEEGLGEMARCMSKCGALTAAVWTDNDRLAAQVEDVAARAGVNSATNLSGDALVNFSAAFSDFHGTGANNACSASLTDGAFITPRFFVSESRRPLPS